HHVADGGSDHSFEGGTAFRQVQELIHGVVAPTPPIRTDYRKADQPVDILVGKGIQNHAVNDAVHGTAAADPECQRTESDCRKHAVLAQTARAVAKVLKKAHRSQTRMAC